VTTVDQDSASPHRKLSGSSVLRMRACLFESAAFNVIDPVKDLILHASSWNSAGLLRVAWTASSAGWESLRGVVCRAGQGETHSDRRTDAWCGDQFDLPRMRIDDAPDDRQTQAGTKTRPSGVETPEPVKRARSVRRGHPFALIYDH